MDAADDFDTAVERALGNKIRASEKAAQEMWSALANVNWHKNGNTAGFTFRSAGDFVAEISGKGSYMDYYCSGPHSTVSSEIKEALASEGWTPEILEG